MKNSNQKRIKNKKHQAAHRITALLLALLLTALTISPLITSRAAEGGEPEDSYYEPTETTNEDGTRTISIRPIAYFHNSKDEVISRYKYNISFQGAGRLVLKSYSDGTTTGIIALSDKPMTYTKNYSYYNPDWSKLGDGSEESNSFFSKNGTNGTFYFYDLYICNGTDVYGLPNMHRFSSHAAWDAWRSDILSNADLSKDDYKTPDSSSTYKKDSTLGYLQGVKYYETKSNIFHGGRKATISWNSSNSNLKDCYIEIRAKNFYTKWWNDTTSEIWTYKKYSDNLSYTDGECSFGALDPCKAWLDEKNISISLNTQSYGTTDYYVRLLRFDSKNNIVGYGGWVKIDINRGTSSQLPDSSSDTGDFDPDTGDWEDDNHSDDSYHDKVDDTGEIVDPSIVTEWSSFLNALNQFFGVMNQGILYLGEFPSLVSTVFSFIPPIFIFFIGVGFSLAVILRFLGR